MLRSIVLINVTGRSTADGSDALLIAKMRLVLATAALLVAFVEVPEGKAYVNWVVFSGYVIHTAIFYFFTQSRKPFTETHLAHWLDVCWYALIVLCSGGSQSPFFLFFFFAVLAASFRCGFEEGRRVVVASATLFFLIGTIVGPDSAFAKLLLRVTFLLGLGYMIAYWGEAEIVLKRRLALLHDVSRLSNPRFGVDNTINSVLEKTRKFFDAQSCILISRDADCAAYRYRIVKKQGSARAACAERIGPELGAPMLALAHEKTVLYVWHPSARIASFLGLNGLHIFDAKCQCWNRMDSNEAIGVAEMLDAKAFISAPVPLRNGEGRIYVAAREDRFSREDALFLSHIASQTFPVIETIALLDHMASEAAAEERHRIARDLHDTTIQPYIGLALGLHAMRKKAQDGNPLIEDLERLTEIGGEVIRELRRYAGSIRDAVGSSGPAFLGTLQRQAEKMARFYDIHIDVSMESKFEISDRLGVEILQMISEGYANIRKHTRARYGWLTVRCFDGCIEIEIGNESTGEAPGFMPRSLSERAFALGGQAWVEHMPPDRTAVRIKIPI
jgi:signal transduction histidine kinase